jgi:hypothetical protein
VALRMKIGKTFIFVWLVRQVMPRFAVTEERVALNSRALKQTSKLTFPAVTARSL